MNFNDAMSHHIIWQLRLKRLVDGMSDEALDPVSVANHEICDLGKWIHDAGSQLADAPAFNDLVIAHTRFHQAAAEVVKHVQAGEIGQAKGILSGEVAHQSREIVGAVVDLKLQNEKH